MTNHMPLKILVAPNAMKGSLSALEFAKAIHDGISSCLSSFETKLYPVADGGDGTGSILSKNLDAKPVYFQVHNPLGEAILAPVFIQGDRAIIEMADASGMKLLTPKVYNPMKASSFGTGELIRRSLETGVRRIILGVGGSATVDGGAGCLEALGFNLIGPGGVLINSNGSQLELIDEIRYTGSMDWRELSFTVLCDVVNPITGSSGSARVFGPQKGATPEQVTVLERGLEHWTDLLNRYTRGRWDDGLYCGAAGGIAGGLQALCGAELVAGAQWILDTIHFEEQIKWADVVITGEGKMDAQSSKGKVPYLVGEWARKQGKHVIAIAGRTEGRHPLFDRCIPLCTQDDMEDFSKAHAAELVKKAVYNLFHGQNKKEGEPF